MQLDARAERNLIDIHHDLVRVVRRTRALCPVAFTVTEGMRTLDRQKKLVAAGASRTLKSRHLTGHAVDIAAMIDFDGDGNLEVTYKSSSYNAIAAYMKQSSRFLKIPITWGGDWKKFKDYCHFELALAAYPTEPLVA